MTSQQPSAGAKNSWIGAVRLGLIVPGDCHVDDEFWRLTAPGAVPVITRTRGSSLDDYAVPRVIALAESPDIDDAADRLRAVAPAAAAYVDTSISFVRGRGGDTEIADRIRRLLRCPTTVTSTAVVEARSEERRVGKECRL